VAEREAAIRDRAAALAAQKAAIDDEIETRLKSGRERIAAEEARSAAADRNRPGAKIERAGRLREVLKERDGKLAEAQKAQAELIRKQRELDDAKREWI